MNKLDRFYSKMDTVQNNIEFTTGLLDKTIGEVSKTLEINISQMNKVEKTAALRKLGYFLSTSFFVLK